MKADKENEKGRVHFTAVCGKTLAYRYIDNG